MAAPQTIRISPSGPDVTNDAGGGFAPGSGARLRLAERTTEIGTTTNIIDTTERVIGSQLLADPNPTQLVATLDSPDPNKQYAAYIRLDVFNTDTTTVINITLQLQVSVDGGTTWVDLQNNEHGVAPAVTGAASPDGEHADSGGFRQIEMRRPLVLGGVGFLVVPTTTSLKVRATVTADAAGAFADSRNVHPGNFGSVLLQLEECL